jgi:alkylhydroperoxidase family enzyme
MANERGRLPKAARDGLDERLQRMLGRWYDTAYRDDNLFLTMARRPGLLDATWGFIRYIYGGGSSIEPELFELVRVRLAWNNRCVH